MGSGSVGVCGSVVPRLEAEEIFTEEKFRQWLNAKDRQHAPIRPETPFRNNGSETLCLNVCDSSDNAVPHQGYVPNPEAFRPCSCRRYPRIGRQVGPTVFGCSRNPRQLDDSGLHSSVNVAAQASTLVVAADHLSLFVH